MHEPDPDLLTAAEAIAAAARALSDVADLSPGRFVSVATYGPKRAIPGLAIQPTEKSLDIDLYVVARYRPGLSLPALATALRKVVRQVIEDTRYWHARSIKVMVDDLAIPPLDAVS